jgi:hypothetical protein
MGNDSFVFGRPSFFLQKHPPPALFGFEAARSGVMDGGNPQ